jgi:hypothetical protein
LPIYFTNYLNMYIFTFKKLTTHLMEIFKYVNVHRWQFFKCCYLNHVINVYVFVNYIQISSSWHQKKMSLLDPNPSWGTTLLLLIKNRLLWLFLFIIPTRVRIWFLNIPTCVKRSHGNTTKKRAMGPLMPPDKSFRGQAPSW